MVLDWIYELIMMMIIIVDIIIMFLNGNWCVAASS